MERPNHPPQNSADLCIGLTLPDFPDKIVNRIIALAGNITVYALRPFLSAGRRSRELVYTSTVLRNCNFGPIFFRNPDAIFLTDGRARHFIKSAVVEENEQAVYFESLNLVVNYEDYEGGLELLEKIAPEFPTGSLASAILCVCLGQMRKASEMFKLFTHVSGIRVDDPKARKFGEELATNIFWLSRKQPNRYISDSLQYPDDDYIKFPDCAYEHFLLHDCNKCYMHRVAERVCSLLHLSE